MRDTCGVCLREGAGVIAPCGHAGAKFHEACLARWCEGCARCPHCNQENMGFGAAVELLRAWLPTCDEETWWRGPVFVCVQEGLMSPMAERAAWSEGLRCVGALCASHGLTLDNASKWGAMWCASSPCGGFALEITLRRMAVSRSEASGGEGQPPPAPLRDGFGVSAVRRRAMPWRRARRP